MSEVWRDVPGYAGVYQVSDHGSVRSIDRMVNGRNGSTHIRKGHTLRSYRVNGGYCAVSLNNGGSQKNFLVHRLVAMAFIPNPNNYETVNHIDENKCNNTVSNLEWLTLIENNRYGSHDERMRKTLSFPVIQYSLDGEFIQEFGSMAEVHRETGFNAASIGKAARGIYKQSNGYIWKYKKDI